MDCRPSGFSVHGISQARILDWVVISFSRRSSRPRDRTCVTCIGGWILYHGATREAPGTQHSIATYVTKLSVRSPACSHLVARSLCALTNICLLPPNPLSLATTVLLPVSQIRLFKTLHAGESIQSFSVWLISPSIISSSIHVVVKGRIPFFSMAEWCLIIHMYHSFFIHSSVDGISVLSNFFQDSVMRKQWLSLTRSLSNKGNLSRHWHLDANRVTATASSPVDPVKAAPCLWHPRSQAPWSFNAPLCSHTPTPGLHQAQRKGPWRLLFPCFVQLDSIASDDTCS